MALAQDDRLRIEKSKIHMNVKNSVGDKPIISIVLPTYKERDNLEIFIPQIESEFDDIRIEIIVVDDNSNDGTRDLVHRLNETYKNISLVERPGLLGIGSALRDGYNLARGEYILSSDADLSFVSCDMRALYTQILTGFDMVLGYKVVSGGAQEERQKKVMTQELMLPVGKACNLIVRIVSGVGGLREYNTNFRIIRSSIWKKIDTVENRNFFLFETIFRASQCGAKIAEIPVTFHARRFGESKLNFLQQAPKYFIDLIRLRFFDGKPSA